MLLPAPTSFLLAWWSGRILVIISAHARFPLMNQLHSDVSSESCILFTWVFLHPRLPLEVFLFLV